MKSRKHIYISVTLLLLFIFLGYFLVVEQRLEARFPFRFGLDLVGGTALVYRADTSKVADVDEAMQSLKEIIERRVNAFGVSEPVIQAERAGLISGNPSNRLIVELPGYKDMEEAKRSLGETPLLEFRLENPKAKEIITANPNVSIDEVLIPTGLTGQYLSRARVEFNQTTGAPIIGLEFNKDGGDLFAQITKEHVGQVLAIILDGAIIQEPTIQEEIKDGKAQITGSYTAQEAKNIVRNLNYGALPVPIENIGAQSIGATLGASALNSGVRAGIIGFIVLSLFLMLWYRLPGMVASMALVSYIILSLITFKLIPVTLTAAGLAGFILSIGMAVDANVLIFERTKEELKKGKAINDALHEGFSRAWLSIRDSNIASIITAVVLFWLGTSAVKGFALTLGIGVLVSMFTAITVSRAFLFAVAPRNENGIKRFLFSNGFHK